MDYIYITDDNLENRQKYTYSEYNGNEFLNAYENSRLIYIKEVEASQESHITYIELSNLLFKLSKEYQIDEKDNVLIDSYVKSFEVRKRIYSLYDEHWNPKSDDRTDYINYILLAKILIRMYNSTKNLKYINCLMKVGDTCLSISNKMPLSLRFELKNILKHELNIYNILKIGIDA